MSQNLLQWANEMEKRAEKKITLGEILGPHQETHGLGPSIYSYPKFIRRSITNPDPFSKDPTDIPGILGHHLFPVISEVIKRKKDYDAWDDRKAEEWRQNQAAIEREYQFQQMREWLKEWNSKNPTLQNLAH